MAKKTNIPNNAIRIDGHVLDGKDNTEYLSHDNILDIK